jgi:chromosome transmission fidelity protein 8
MKVPIFCESTQEWCIVEMQGQVHVREPPAPTASDPDPQLRLDGMEVGSIRAKSATDVVMTVGNYEIDGRRIALSKPIAVLKKVRQQSPGGDDEDEEKMALHVVGVVRHKYLFKSRPRAILRTEKA